MITTLPAIRKAAPSASEYEKLVVGLGGGRKTLLPLATILDINGIHFTMSGESEDGSTSKAGKVVLTERDYGRSLEQGDADQFQTLLRGEVVYITDDLRGPFGCWVVK